ncbi:MAG TPA: maleylpyruvate isomerase N-terminal domain-containing protein [Acidimicrobiales bacterium]|jgi:hypothetical protein|nr:maleylpyruvate isomerase N-terminal domain-containing protein [Acidimicrobiales bacterium]
MTATTPVDWPAARQAVARAGPRLTSMLRSAKRADRQALGDWDLTGVAAHISHACDTILAMSRGGGNVIPNIAGLSTLTRVMVAGEGRRPLGELADRIDATVAEFLSAMQAAGTQNSSHAWLVEGTEMPLSTLTCHMLNELTVHGLDIARAEGVPWPIDRGDASLILQGFVFPSLHTLGRDMVVLDKAGKKRARFEIRLRGDGRAWFVFADGDFSVEGLPDGPVDCHLSVDPTAFLLVAWARQSQWPAIAKGQLLAWGKKPWLGVELRSWLRNP